MTGQHDSERAARLGAESADRRSRVIREPMVCTMRHPPNSVPSEIAV